MLSSKLGTPLLGIAIGNGWMDARRQYPSFLDYAVKHGLLEENSEVLSIVPSDAFRLMDVAGMEGCQIGY
jgi:hypothetical protein